MILVSSGYLQSVTQKRVGSSMETYPRTNVIYLWCWAKYLDCRSNWEAYS